MNKVVVVGGGTGTFVVLTGLKKYPLDLSVIVSMMDSGGSTGRLRDQLGVLPPGDLRQCLVALSETSDLWRSLFLYRFQSGDLAGHNFGNIFLTALEKTAANYQEVVDNASFILKTKGEVIPVTFDKVNLCVQYEDGEVIEKEARIDKAIHKRTRIKRAFLKPKAKANKRAVLEISQSNYIIIGPGDLYTSLIPNLIVEGIKEAIIASKAKIIGVVNLMTKSGQTTGYKASDHLKDIESYLARKINTAVVNTGQIPKQALAHYKKFKEQPVKDDLSRDRRVIRLDLVSRSIYKKSKVDSTVRSLVRHDPDKLGQALFKIITADKKG